MNWKFWTWQRRMREQDSNIATLVSNLEYARRENERLERVNAASTAPKFVLHGWNEAQFRQAFLTAPDSDLHKGVLEQCDLSLMEAVNELVNGADEMSDGVLRQRVGELRGITELRASFELRAEQARKDQQAVATGETEKKED